MPSVLKSVYSHLSKEPRLLNKVCIISGASRGFGQAIAVRFLEEGANVVMLSRSSCAETVALMNKIEGVTPEYVDSHSLWVSSDIESEEDCNKAASASATRFGGKIDVLVNNAALFVFHSVEHATATDWDRSAAVNIKGHALLTKACLPYMKAAGGGSIVFQGSISAFLAQPDCATYSTMKGAILQLARNCAYDCEFDMKRCIYIIKYLDNSMIILTHLILLPPPIPPHPPLPPLPPLPLPLPPFFYYPTLSIIFL
jgi:NAD(P)-dependent dehydrogenase (short-subunit alcohol dehydrogenase family)